MTDARYQKYTPLTKYEDELTGNLIEEINLADWPDKDVLPETIAHAVLNKYPALCTTVGANFDEILVNAKHYLQVMKDMSDDMNTSEHDD